MTNFLDAPETREAITKLSYALCEQANSRQRYADNCLSLSPARCKTSVTADKSGVRVIRELKQQVATLKQFLNDASPKTAALYEAHMTKIDSLTRLRLALNVGDEGDLVAAVAGLQDQAATLTQQLADVIAKERREFAWAEKYMAKSRTLELKLEAAERQVATLTEALQRERAEVLKNIRAFDQRSAGWRTQIAAEALDARVIAIDAALAAVRGEL